MSQSKSMREVALEHNLTDEEYDFALSRLGREPNATEIGVLGAMWSEHCSYKSSRVHLRTLPTTGPQVVVGPGENAGAVDIGDGWCAVFKMESHNHPSFIEPYQGAATGVGGILRDVFTMGARPVASLNALRFGAPDHPRTAFLMNGVIGGIAGYGNCMGVPTVGGEVFFDPSYNGNILVNAFTAGICRHDEIFKGVASGIGNPILYVGAKTGRDGINGAKMASAGFSSDGDDQRPTVQVGDPFREKLLLEACLELFKEDAVIGIQDMGAAGLTSSSTEMAGRGGCGVFIDLDLVPTRESAMTAYEMLLSESQERMLMVVKDGREHVVKAIFDKWDLDSAVIGRVTDTGRWVVSRNGEIAADMPVDFLTDEAPVYDRPRSEPARFTHRKPLDRAALPALTDAGSTLLTLLGSPNICSRRSIYEQYDHMVGAGTVQRPGGDAAVVRITGTDRAIALAVDCNPRHVFLDPYQGAARAVAECSRNVACTGARPLGLTDCLNFGDVKDPEIMWEFAEAVRGLGVACRALDVPIVSGNVSLYNATGGASIKPTPSVAVVGSFDGPFDASKVVRHRVAQLGLELWLVGPQTGTLDGSEFAALAGFGDQGMLAPVDLDLEARLQNFLIAGAAASLFAAAHDLSEGGLAVAVAEMFLGQTAVGAALTASLEGDLATALFHEGPSRVVLAVSAENSAAFVAAAQAASLPLLALGQSVAGDRLEWSGVFSVSLAEATARFDAGLDPIRRGRG